MNSLHNTPFNGWMQVLFTGTYQRNRTMHALLRLPDGKWKFGCWANAEYYSMTLDDLARWRWPLYQEGERRMCKKCATKLHTYRSGRYPAHLYMNHPRRITQ